MAFFHDFVQNLLTASRVIPLSSLNSTSLDVSLESLSAMDGDDNEVESSSTATEFSKAAEDSSNVRVVVDGKVYFYPITNTVADTPEQDYVIKESISHSMLVYLTLWGAEDLENELAQCGMSSPRVIAVLVDGNPVELPEHDGDVTGESSASDPVEISSEVTNPGAATMTSIPRVFSVSTCFFGSAVMLVLLA
ncbi:MAG: hypothetical protein SGILL_002119 [Bacillariaceae sp.]